MTDTEQVGHPYSEDMLPRGVRSRHVAGVNGLTVHLLEAGFEAGGRPLVLLLHGFPEIAYSWRKVIAPLAAAGFHVVAPDQRGYGRTEGWDGDYDGDLRSFSLLNLAKDALALVSALGHDSVAAVIGHDFGSAVAATCALVRPDVFRSVAFLSAPFAGPPRLPFDTAAEPHDGARDETRSATSLDDELAALDRPRKHYHQYYSTRPANDEMLHCAQGVHAFLRAYFHHKSADWEQNRPHPLAARTAAEMAKMPTYYIMELDQDMAETVAAEMPSDAAVAACEWLIDDELSVYGAEYERTGFQGGLQRYRCGTTGINSADLALFSGRTIDVPACFIAGTSDWGAYQAPGNLERMQDEACTDWRGTLFVEGAGHWVQQEQPERVVELLEGFLRDQ
jgi:pimeloyl-ACP methyl ester carboxylesterase